MRNLFRITIISLIVVLLMMAHTTPVLAQWGDISMCNWIHGGCLVSVWQFSSQDLDLSWSMYIFCVAPLYSGAWYGSGAWGGDCKGLWITPH